MKSGFAVLIGKPNVGKSSIINLLTNKKTSIVSPKAQTTRNNILGILDNANYQIVFTDTPGINSTNTLLGKSMNKKSREAMRGADIIILVLDVSKGFDEEYLKSFANKKIDIILLNKIDLSTIIQVTNCKNKIKEFFKEIELMEFCAKDGFNKDELLNFIINKLPESPKFYPNPEDVIDDGFFVKEIIREKVLYLLSEEVPHNIAINLKDIKKKKESMFIKADILVSKDSQKGIVIGKNGKMIKIIGTKSRNELEKYFNKRIFLELSVKVREDWINSVKDLKDLGY